MHFVKKIIRQELFLAVGSILLVAIVTHGLRLAELGFYYDDWYVLWSAAARGAESLGGLFITDRPAMGRLYTLVYQVLGDSMMGWHLYALGWRCVGALAFFWIIRTVWPKYKTLSTMAAVLFVVYPAFLSEPDALTKVNHLTGFGLALLSIALMLGAITNQNKKARITLNLMALIAGSAYVWIYEYMIGLEALRLVLLAVHLHRKETAGISSLLAGIARQYWPYVLTISAFLFWRFFIFSSVRPATNVESLISGYGSSPLDGLIRVISQTLLDFLSVTVFAWFVKLYHLLAGAEPARIAVAAMVGGTGLGIVILYRLLRGKDEGTRDHTALELAVVGLVGTLFAILPVTISDRSIDLLDAYKSYGLHPSAGAILLVMSGLVVLKESRRQVVFLALLFCSMATHSLNIDHWRTLWQVERNMWWQVSWRAPDLADNTFVMALAPDAYLYMQDYETWGPLNLIYRPGRYKAPPIQSEVLNVDTLQFVKNRTVSDWYARDISLRHDYRNLLLISQPTLDACVHVIDGRLPVFSAKERLVVTVAGPYSNIDRILPESSFHTPPVSIFGGEPAHSWCYYFQKASLARQLRDWKTVIELYAEAQKNGLKAADPSEYFPFLEALVNLGRMDEANNLNEAIIQKDEPLKASLCDSLKADPVYPPGFIYDHGSIRALICGN